MYYGKAAVSSFPGSAAAALPCGLPAAGGGTVWPGGAPRRVGRLRLPYRRRRPGVGTQGSSIVYLHDDELMQVAGSTAANRARPYYSYSSLTLP